MSGSDGDGSRGWVDVQKLAFTRWTNVYLAQRGLKAEDVQNDFKSGVLLHQLLEVISDRKLPKCNMHPQIRIQRLNNLNVCLKFIKDQGLQLVNIGAEDIETGNLKIILGLLWLLILRYQIEKFDPSFGDAGDGRRLSVKGSKQQGGKDESEGYKESLLRWVNERIKPYVDNKQAAPIQDFTKSFQDGRVLCALTDALRPGVIDMKNVSPSNPVGNCHMAIDTALQEFDIINIMDAEDVVNAPQEHAMMVYMSFFQKFAKTGHSLQQQSKAAAAAALLLQQQQEKERLAEEARKRAAELEAQNRALEADGQRRGQQYEQEKRDLERRAREQEEKLQAQLRALKAEQEEQSRLIEEQKRLLAKQQEEMEARARQAQAQMQNSVQQQLHRQRLLAEEQRKKEQDQEEELQRMRARLADMENASQANLLAASSASSSASSSSSGSAEEVEWVPDFTSLSIMEDLDAPGTLPDDENDDDESGKPEEEPGGADYLNLANILGYRMAHMNMGAQKFQLTVGCTSLLKMGLIGRSNPMVGLFVRGGSGNNEDGFLLVDSTEWIPEDHDPVFVKPLVVYHDLVKDARAEYRIVVWSVPESANNSAGINTLPAVSDKDMIGLCNFSMNKLAACAEDSRSGGILRLPLTHPASKMQVKLSNKGSTVSITTLTHTLRVTRIHGAKEKIDHRGDRIFLKATLHGQATGKRCLALGLFEAVGGGSKELRLVSVTEWVRKTMGKVVVFGLPLTVFAYTQRVARLNSEDKYLRLCLYEVPEPDKATLRATTGKYVVQVSEEMIIAYRDFRLSDVLGAIKYGGLSYSFKELKPQGKGTFLLNGTISPEVTQARVCEVLEKEVSHHIGHEVEIQVECKNLFKMDLTSPADPFIAVFERDPITTDYCIIGQTKWEKSQSNVKFDTPIRLCHDLLSDTTFRVNVYDISVAHWDAQRSAASGPNKPKQNLPLISACDGDLTKEPTFMGMATVNLQTMLIQAALNEPVELPLSFPAAQAHLEARGELKNEAGVADEWWRAKRLLDKKASIVLTIKVHHACPQEGIEMHPKKLVLERPKDTSTPVTVVGYPRRSPDDVGHTVIMRVSAKRLLKMDWASYTDPIVVLLERVKISPPSQGKPAPQAAKGWACPMCTFNNKDAFLACEMCNSPRPSESRNGQPQQVQPAADRPRYEWHVLDQTEWALDTLDPVFQKKLSVHYDPDSDHDLRFAVFDVDSEVVGERDLIGFADTKLTNIVSCADGDPLELKLLHFKLPLAKTLEEKQTVLHITSTLRAVRAGEYTSEDRARESQLHLSSSLFSGPRALSLRGVFDNDARDRGCEYGFFSVNVGFKNLPKMNWWTKSNPVVVALEEDISGHAPVATAMAMEQRRQSGLLNSARRSSRVNSKVSDGFNILISNTECLRSAQEGVFAGKLSLPAIPEKNYRLKVFNVLHTEVVEAGRGAGMEDDALIGYCDVSVAQLSQVARNPRKVRKNREPAAADESAKWGLKLQLFHRSKAMGEALLSDKACIYLDVTTATKKGSSPIKADVSSSKKGKPSKKEEKGSAFVDFLT